MTIRYAAVSELPLRVFILAGLYVLSGDHLTQITVSLRAIWASVSAGVSFL